MLALIAVGCIKLFFGILPKSLPENAGSLKASFDSVGIVLLLRAFSSGCTALTGIEAVANGVPIFQEPKSKNASLVLLMVAGLLAILFLGITFLAYYLGITPNPDESLVSQISRRVLVEPWLYYPIQAATMLVLFLAANTAFNGFPLLASILAKDNYLPQQFSHLGDRLAFSNGIIVLAISSIILLIVFKGSTHSLVPLYAIGVFLCFSLSQAGMVRRWYRLKTKNWELKAIVNGVGAATTTLALLVIVESKLLEGAWLTVGLLVPLFLFLFNKTKIYYQNLSLELRKSLQGQLGDWVRSAVNPQASQVVVLVSRLHRGTFLALKFARSLSPNVIAVTVNTQPKGTAELQLAWEALCIREPLLVLESPFRSVVDPLIRYLDLLDLEKKSPESPIIVVLPEFITSKWWHKLLHNQTAFLLKTALLYRKELQGKTHNRIIVNVPYQVKT
jgi:amino acid transporter